MNCPACIAHRLHSPDELACYHPLAGHGYQEGQGWSSPEAEQAHIADVRTNPSNPTKEKTYVAHA